MPDLVVAKTLFLTTCQLGSSDPSAQLGLGLAPYPKTPTPCPVFGPPSPVLARIAGIPLPLVPDTLLAISKNAVKSVQQDSPTLSVVLSPLTHLLHPLAVSPQLSSLYSELSRVSLPSYGNSYSHSSIAIVLSKFFLAIETSVRAIFSLTAVTMASKSLCTQRELWV